MRGVRRVALGMAFSFFILSLGLVYWQVVQADTLLENPANRRLILMENRVTRGGIFDRNGEIIAQTQISKGKKKHAFLLAFRDLSLCYYFAVTIENSSPRHAVLHKN